MRTTERLRCLKTWAEQELCAGRLMKAPASNFLIANAQTVEPRCFIGWTPMRPDTTGRKQDDPVNVAPSILVMPSVSKGKFMEALRFDRYDEIRRPKELGQTLAISMLFSVYEPGVRLPGYIESVEAGEEDMSLLMEGTEQGLFTLFNWMDDCVQELLGRKVIPNSDMIVNEETIFYSLHSDSQYIQDKRPVYYGFVNVEFQCYAEEGVNRTIEQYLS